MAFTVITTPTANLSYNASTKRVVFSGTFQGTVSKPSIFPSCGMSENNWRHRTVVGFNTQPALNDSDCDFWKTYVGSVWSRIYSTSSGFNQIFNFSAGVNAKVYNQSIRNNANAKLVIRGYHYDNSASNLISRHSYFSDAYGSAICNPCGKNILTNGVVIVNIVSLPPLKPDVPTYDFEINCINNNLVPKITLTDISSVGNPVFSLRKSPTLLGTYTEIAVLDAGNNYSYEDTSGEEGYYKVYATNDLYEDDVFGEVKYFGGNLFPPIIEANTIQGNYPTLTFTAQTTNFNECVVHDAVYWYLDGDFVGSGTTNTFEDELPTENDIHILTAKFKIGSNLSDFSNEVELQFLDPTVITSGFTSNGTMVIPEGFNRMDYLLVGGGGGGGGARNGSGIARGGGGGAGGLRYGTVANPVAGTYNVVRGNAGAGGIGGSGDFNPSGSNGGNTSFYGLTANGGGGGGGRIVASYLGVPVNTAHNGYGGGSGGGGAAGANKVGSGGGRMSGQGNVGAAGSGDNAGGGGGKGAAGSGSLGGTGFTTNISGSNVTYSKGGDGATSSGNGTSAQANTGNGGSGGGNDGSTHGNGGNGGSGVVWIELYNVPLTLLAPTIQAESNLACSQVRINWINNSTIDIEGNYVQVLSGSTWVTIASVGATTTNYTVTGLTENTEYVYRVVSYFDNSTRPSNSVSIQTLSANPFNLTGIFTDYLAISLQWDLECTDVGNEIEIQLRETGDIDWNVVDTIPNTGTTFTYTGLSYNKSYEMRVVRVGSEFPSNIISFNTPVFLAPTDLEVTDVTSTSISIAWQNHSFNDGIAIYYEIDGEGYQIYEIVTPEIDTFTLTGLTMLTTYNIYVANISNIDELDSNIVQETTLLSLLPNLCTIDDPLTVINSVCGLATGSIGLSETLYLNWYDFELTTVLGTPIAFAGGIAQNLPSGYYFLKATPKPEFWQFYGSQPCMFNWIRIEDEDTDITLNGLSIKPAICQGFGRQRGRIGLILPTGTTYTVNFYTSDRKLANSQTGVTSPVIYHAQPMCYFITIENAIGCKLLLDSICVPSEDIYTVEGIEELYLTKYDEDLIINYWDATNEDFFIGGFDENFYTSTKIKEILNTTTWYEIPLISADAKYNQSLNRDQNGITYSERIDIVVHHKDIQKWNDLLILLEDRYVLVFKDRNQQWWCFGIQGGTEIREYRLEENAYKFSFIQPAVTKLLAAIDENYVKTYIK